MLWKRDLLQLIQAVAYNKFFLEIEKLYATDYRDVKWKCIWSGKDNIKKGRDYQSERNDADFSEGRSSCFTRLGRYSCRFKRKGLVSWERSRILFEDIGEETVQTKYQ